MSRAGSRSVLTCWDYRQATRYFGVLTLVYPDLKVIYVFSSKRTFVRAVRNLD
jgi:hypothetical protein